MENLSERLINKSIEAFIMGLEIYNKPTIKYRIEGFSFFIVNAWELMLKAELLNRGESIYFVDKPDRTLSVENVLKKIYTDKSTRIRLNLEKIIELRNISTHYITEDYEVKYAPLFQACVLNFVNEIQRFHQIDITKYIAQNFLTISTTYDPLTNEEIKLKYSPEIAEKLIRQSNEIDVLSTAYDSDKFAINIRQNLYITKKKLKLDYKSGFNQYVLNLIIDFYDIKQDTKYAYEHIIGNQHSYTYSQQFIDFIVSEIEKSPSNFVESLKKSK